MRYFMEHSVLPYLREKLGIREVIVSRVLKLFGIGESLVDERLKDLIEEGTIIAGDPDDVGAFDWSVLVFALWFMRRGDYAHPGARAQ